MNSFNIARKALAILCTMTLLVSVESQAMTCSEQVLAAKSEKASGTQVQLEKLKEEKTGNDKLKGAGYMGFVIGLVVIVAGFVMTGGVGMVILVAVGAGVGDGSLYYAKTREASGANLQAQMLTKLETPSLYQKSKDYLEALKKDPKTEMDDELLAFKSGIKNKDVLTWGVPQAIIQVVDKNENNTVCDGDKIATPREILDALNNEKTRLLPASGS